MAYASLSVIEDLGKFSRQSSAKFVKLLAPKMQRIERKFAGMVMDVPSDGPAEQYPAFGATPQLKEYDEGEVPGAQIDAYDQLVKNRQFGMSISVGRNFFADLNRMPGARAILQDRIANGLSTRGANYTNVLIAKMLLQSGTYANMTAYDGYALFSASHPGGTNLVSGANDFSQPTLRDEHSAMLDTFAGMKDPDNADFLREEAPNKLIYLVDPQYLADYAMLLRSIYVPAGVNNSAGNDVVAAAAVENPMALANNNRMSGIDGLGNETTLIGWSRLRNSGYTFVVDASGEVDGPPALLHQVREAPTLEYLGPSESNPVWVLGEKVTWKVRRRGEIGIGDPAKIIRISGKSSA